MIGNYLIVTFRNLVRHKLYSFINIAGLTVGLTCAIFIILFVRDQLSYDRWIPGTENLYRLEVTVRQPGKPPSQSAMTGFPMAQAMVDQIPEVQARTRLTRTPSTILIGNRQFPERLYTVDPNFLQMIRLPLAAGDPNTVLTQPESVVLSETAARRYFGASPALGKTIILSGKHCQPKCEPMQAPMVVTGILRDLPHNSQFLIDVVIPNTSTIGQVDQNDRENWLWFAGWSYLRLVPGADLNGVVAKFRAVVDHSVDLGKIMNVHEPASVLMTPYLTPLTDAHLSSDRFHGMTPPGNWAIVYGFSAIGALILLIACFNFTNLATARATMRAREISLRKVVGARRRQLVVQFLGEAVVTAMIALVLALALTEILLPLFDRVLGLPIGLNYVRDWPLLLGFAAVGVLAGLLSGAYPALVLSGFRPAATLRVQHGGLAGSGMLRTVLVVLQFAVSIGLGIAASVIFSQITFARNVDLGFHKDQTVIVDIRNIVPETADSMSRALRAGADITEVATSSDIPFTTGHTYSSGHTPGDTSSEQFMNVVTSPEYMRLYGIKLLGGRLLSQDRPADGLMPEDVRGGHPFNVLVNATLARRMGYSPQTAIGKTVVLNVPGKNTVTVVGVVADSKLSGSKTPIEGTMYQYWRAFPEQYLSIRIRDGHVAAALSFIDRALHAFAPSTALQRHFLDDDYDQQFQADERQGMLFGVFVGIAIFISCLGLFGLAAFSTERRTREIGLRKTFGAGTNDIIWMLLWQFSVPVLIANAIAWPVAWYYLHDWLQGFAYCITLSPLYFLGAGAIALVIAWATVFTHARRVAGANPIHALRYE
jgi:putative ABC transport system permease protein